jgi:hypothetical protein
MPTRTRGGMTPGPSRTLEPAGPARGPLAQGQPEPAEPAAANGFGARRGLRVRRGPGPASGGRGRRGRPTEAHLLHGEVLDVLVAPQNDELVAIQVRSPTMQLVEVQEEVPQDKVLPMPQGTVRVTVCNLDSLSKSDSDSECSFS